MKIKQIAGAVLASLLFVGGCRTLPDTDFRDVIVRAKSEVFPTLVYIRVVREALERGKADKQVVSGSGVVISPDGEILTNHHVVDKATEIRCQLSDGSSFMATKVGEDKDLDVALLKLDRPVDAHRLPFAELSSETLQIGDVVLAMGAPWGLARSVTMGIVSCVDRYLEGAGEYTLWYQTDASISPGNSGGPLVDTQGRVVGLNTRGIMFGGQAFTIPSPTILEVLPRLREFGDGHWAWFGFKFQPLHDFNHNIYFPATNGVVVSDAEAGSPARKAGFLSNDRIVAVDGKPVTALNSEDLPAFRRQLGRLAFGQEVAFDVVRGGTNLVLRTAPCEKGRVEGVQKAFERWGFTAKEINRFANPDLAFFASEGGVYVAAVAWDGNAWTSGLKEQDILLTWNGKPVKSVADLETIYAQAMKDLPGTSRANLEVLRRGRKTQIVLNYLEDTEKEVLE